LEKALLKETPLLKETLVEDSLWRELVATYSVGRAHLEEASLGETWLQEVCLEEVCLEDTLSLGTRAFG